MVYAQGANWLTGWDYRKSIQVSGTIGAGTDYQVNLTMSLFEGPPENAANNITVPTYDGSGQAIHPGVVYFSNGWNGYKYWMAMTPYPNGAAALEAVSIVACNDSISWEVPIGLVNPIDPAPGGGNYDSDTDLFYDSVSDQLWCYWRWTDDATEDIIYRLTSVDGINWIGKTALFNGSFGQILSPSIVKEGSTYYMFTINATGGVNPINRYSSNNGIAWGNKIIVSLQGTLLAGKEPWHMETIYNSTKGDYWHLITVTSTGSNQNGELMFGRGHNTTVIYLHEGAFLSSGGGGSWDDGSIYRTTGIRINQTTLQLWYSANNGTLLDTWNIGYTTVTLSVNTSEVVEQAKGDLSDLRFTDNNGDTLLDYWIPDTINYENWTIWVQVNDNLDTNGTIYVYYGNEPVPTTSNITLASWNEIGDDFNDNAIAGRWTQINVGAGTVAETNQELQITGNGVGTGSGLHTKLSYPFVNVSIEVDMTQGSLGDALWVINTAVSATSPYGEDNWYRAMLFTDNNFYMQRKAGGGAVQTIYNAVRTSASNNVKIRESGGNATVYEGDIMRATEPYALVGSTNYIYLYDSREAGDGTDEFDNFWARKYVQPEPALTGYGAEETAPTPPIPPVPPTGNLDLLNASLAAVIQILPLIALVVFLGGSILVLTKNVPFVLVVAVAFFGAVIWIAQQAGWL